jgi:hypothetical protein
MSSADGAEAEAEAEAAVGEHLVGEPPAEPFDRRASSRSSASSASRSAQHAAISARRLCDSAFSTEVRTARVLSLMFVGREKEDIFW